jgi:pyruvate,orthophosphate dikinase
VKKLGHDPKPEVMIPLVATQRELLYLRETLEEEIATRHFAGSGQRSDFPIGTMKLGNSLALRLPTAK